MSLHGFPEFSIKIDYFSLQILEQPPCLDRSKSHCLFRLRPRHLPTPSFTWVSCSSETLADYNVLFKFTAVRVAEYISSHFRKRVEVRFSLVWQNGWPFSQLGFQTIHSRSRCHDHLSAPNSQGSSRPHSSLPATSILHPPRSQDARRTEKRTVASLRSLFAFRRVISGI